MCISGLLGASGSFKISVFSIFLTDWNLLHIFESLQLDLNIFTRQKVRLKCRWQI